MSGGLALTVTVENEHASSAFARQEFEIVSLTAVRDGFVLFDDDAKARLVVSSDELAELTGGEGS